MIESTHPAYVLALEDLTQFYDMRLVTFGVDPDCHCLVVTFPVLVKHTHNTKLAAYQIESIPVPIQDENEEANSYTQVQITKPYIAVRENRYIQLRVEEMRNCKRIADTHFLNSQLDVSIFSYCMHFTFCAGTFHSNGKLP